MKLVSALAAIVATAANSQSIYDLFGTEQFHRAYFEANTDEITFEPFLELNWEAKARAALPWLNLDRPTPAQIARLSTFDSAGPQFRSVDFRASRFRHQSRILPLDLRGRHHSSPTGLP